MRSHAILAALAATALLSGCANNTAAIANLAALCGKPPLRQHTVSRNDRLTEETAKQLEEDNAALPAICPGVGSAT